VSPGCYLLHAGAGQLRLLRARLPIEQVLADAAAPEEVRERLGLVLEVREFARGLGLAVGRQYTSYAPWPGDRVVTVVVATRPGELEPAGFLFPLLGRLPYKGFFDRRLAEAEAERLRTRHHDVCVSAVPAYSTLGWLDDPVTGPMLRAAPGVLVDTLIHELVHATVFARGQADFNEGLASFVGQEAAVRFFEAREGASSEAARLERARVADERRVSAALFDLREAVAALYDREPPGAEREASRLALAAAARESVAALELASTDAGALAQRLALNDACLALESAYTRDMPHYAERLADLGGDLAELIRRARLAAAHRDPRALLLGARS
jgi:predicted aminopeptidase